MIHALHDHKKKANRGEWRISFGVICRIVVVGGAHKTDLVTYGKT